MGIKNLWPLLHRTSAAPVNLSSLRGQKVGIDFSLWLVAILQTSREIIEKSFLGVNIEIKPEIRSHIASRLSDFVRNGILPILVLDGAKNPLKQGTNAARNAKRDEAGENVKKAYRDEVDVTYEELMGFKKKWIGPDSRIQRMCIEILQEIGASFIVSPYEADSQLAYMERVHIIAAIVSTDGDMIGLGARNVLKYKNGQYYRYGINDLEKVMGDDLGDASFSLEDPLARGMIMALMGTDYNDHMSDVGPAMFCNFYRGYIRAEKMGIGDQYIRDFFQSTRKFRALGPQDQSAATERYMARLKGARDYFAGSAPAFHIESDLDWTNPEHRYQWKLSLGPVFGDVTTEWREKWLVPLLHMLPDNFNNNHESNLVHFANGFVWARDRKLLNELPPDEAEHRVPIALLQGVEAKVSALALLNFDFVPPKYVPIELLAQWLAYRGVFLSDKFVRDSNNQSYILRMVKKKWDEGGMSPSGGITSLGCHPTRHGTFYSHDASNKLVKMDVVDCYRRVLVKIGNLEVDFDDSTLELLIGSEVASQDRAINRFTNGYLDYKKLSCWNEVDKDTRTTVYTTFLIHSTATTKEKLPSGSIQTDHRVVLRFSSEMVGNEEKVIFRPPPYSRCTCYPGISQCSHMSAFILFIKYVQDTSNNEALMKKYGVEKLLPTPFVEYRSTPIPLYLLCKLIKGKIL